MSSFSISRLSKVQKPMTCKKITGLLIFLSQFKDEYLRMFLTHHPQNPQGTSGGTTG